MMFDKITSKDIEILSCSFDEFENSWLSESAGKISLTPIVFQTDSKSINYQPPQFETETVSPEYHDKKLEYRIKKISEMINKMVNEEDLFKEVDKNEVIRYISNAVNRGLINLNEIPDEELLKRIERLLVLEAMSHLLDGLTSEQIKQFNEAVKRKPF